MGGSVRKQEFRRAILELVSSNQSVTTLDASFWERFWSNPSLVAADYFSMVTYQDIRTLRDKASGNLTALCFKVVERIASAAGTACTGHNEQLIVLNCANFLLRLLPFLFEAPDWRLLFWSPANFLETREGEQPQALAQVLLNSLTDLLFCPDFTVVANVKLGPENPDVLSSLDSCEYIWEKGIGSVDSPGSSSQMDNNRSTILTLLITCFSEALYLSPTDQCGPNRWLAHFTSSENRHILPLLTSLLNTVCSYDPVGYGVPYYYAMVSDPRGHLVETSIQLLSVVLDYNPPGDLMLRQRHLQQTQTHSHGSVAAGRGEAQKPEALNSVEMGMANLFCSFVSRLQMSELMALHYYPALKASAVPNVFKRSSILTNMDLEFIARGLTTLLMNPLRQTYLPHSIKKIYFSQELYIILWKLFELNQKFTMHVLRSSCLFDLVVPLLHQLLITRTNAALVGMLHMGTFILLLLSGERNFGVRLNKPYTIKIPFTDIPKFTGSHADLLFLVFHKIITSGLPRLQPLYDCLLTVMVNVSPYLKGLSMVTSARLLHLMESFATPWFLFAKPTNHYLVFYLLEIFNNVIQYQFDGNTNLVYTIIRSKAVFHQLVNLSEASYQLSKKPQEISPGREAAMGGKPFAEETLEASSGDHEGVSISSSGDRVADLQPVGQVQTVQVEVAPDAGHLSDVEEDPVPAEPNEISKEEISDGTTGCSASEPPASDLPASEPPASNLSASEPPASNLSAAPASTPVNSNTFHACCDDSKSLLINSTVAEGLEEAGRRATSSTKKKSKKSKPVSVKDLIPLHQDVGKSNRQLVEPLTPDFQPTSEWVHSWKQKLPLETVLRVLKVLVPQVEKICTENDVKSELEILAYLKNGTLVGLLPVPHPIIIRKYQASEATELWFHTYIWGVIYVRNFDPPIWYDTAIKLFQVHTTDLQDDKT